MCDIYRRLYIHLILKQLLGLFIKSIVFQSTLYSKGIDIAFDLLRISKLEKLWFGKHVYIFDDNRLWIEKNFTLTELFQTVNNNG